VELATGENEEAVIVGLVSEVARCGERRGGDDLGLYVEPDLSRESEKATRGKRRHGCGFVGG
jgi:hypothetical protein